MTEKQLLEQVLVTCTWLGLLAYHNHDSRRSQRGFPDLVIAGPGGVLWVELKSATGRLSPEQETWRRALRGAGQVWCCWQPADWHSGMIVARLTKLARH